MSTIALESALDLMGEPLRSFESFCFYDEILGTICEESDVAQEGVGSAIKGAGNKIAWVIDKLIEVVKKATASLSGMLVGFGKLKTIYLSEEFDKEAQAELKLLRSTQAYITDVESAKKAMSEFKSHHEKAKNHAVHSKDTSKSTDLVSYATSEYTKYFKDTIKELQTCYKELTAAKSAARGEDSLSAQRDVEVIKVKIIFIKKELAIYQRIISGAKAGAHGAANLRGAKVDHDAKVADKKASK